MGILDEAIREHLELKRQHGADDSELKQLEDAAFGPPERPGDEAASPDPLAEAPTEFMAEPEAPGKEASGAPDGEAAEETSPRHEAAARIADLQEPPQPAEPAEEEQPAEEHEAIAEPPTDGPSTEERQAIAEPPTEMYDVEEELGGSEPQAPSEEDLADEEFSGPRLAPVDPLGSLDEGDEADAVDDAPAADEEGDDFFDEQRLSDELDQALEAPLDSDEEDEPDEGRAPAAADGEEVSSSSANEEDVLEETPDFLEETPEDDELWFEQKPPKDFDFDD